MKPAILLFNGILFSHVVVAKAIAWATQSKQALHAVFIYTKKDKTEGYVYSGDLAAASQSTTGEDAIEIDFAVIQSNIRLLRREAVTANVELELDLMEDPKE